MANFTEQLQRIVRNYIDSGQPWPASTREIAAWAIQCSLWEPHPSALINQCADQIARAMREEYFTDPQGRSVRAKHVAKVERGGEQIPLWADIRSASRDHMEMAFQQRRRQIVGDCRQLKADVDSFNENRSPENPIQVIFNFTYDVEEVPPFNEAA